MNNLCVNCQRADMCLCKAAGDAAVIECERYTPKTTQSVISFDFVTDGLKHDGGKLRLDLVPAELIEAVGAVMTHGVEKYGEGSYRRVEPKRYRAALMRHICKWLKDPYSKDADSGLPHLWHIACNVAFLLELDNPQHGESEKK